MSKGLCRILYIPDWVTFKWCKEQEEHYHIFLSDYAVYHDEPIDHIKEEAEVKAYDALQELKNEGGLNISNYSGQNADLNSFINYVLSEFIIRGNKSDTGIVLNLGYSEYKKKLLNLIEKEKSNGR